MWRRRRYYKFALWLRRIQILAYCLRARSRTIDSPTSDCRKKQSVDTTTPRKPVQPLALKAWYNHNIRKHYLISYLVISSSWCIIFLLNLIVYWNVFDVHLTFFSYHIINEYNIVIFYVLFLTYDVQSTILTTASVAGPPWLQPAVSPQTDSLPLQFFYYWEPWVACSC